MHDVTLILSKIEAGDPSAARELLPLVYEELRKLAAARMASERPDHTLQATALVHEAYLRLVDSKKTPSWDSRGHFFAAASEAMRRILIESARAKSRQKRGVGVDRVQDFDLAGVADATIIHSPDQLLEVDEALERLRTDDPLVASVVTLRLYGGLTIREAAEVLGIPRSTADGYWQYALSWFAVELQ
ncbi:MAG: sigma-70 family RNA polymerase sigma factor [Planctomyces sp.]|nr:sigma-70 family RNA polymerase sigma factor [Planctomyces sp.]